MSGFGATSGHGGRGAAFDERFQTPREHCARRVPQRPKSQVVPSGSRHSLPLTGRTEGQVATSVAPSSVPPSGCTTLVSALEPQAPAMAAAADPSTRTAAIRVRAPARERTVTRPE
jgi:hypothetical protein